LSQLRAKKPSLLNRYLKDFGPGMELAAIFMGIKGLATKYAVSGLYKARLRALINNPEGMKIMKTLGSRATIPVEVLESSLRRLTQIALSASTNEE